MEISLHLHMKFIPTCYDYHISWKQKEEVMLTIKELKVTYGNQVALSIEEPLTIEAGDRIGIIGSNGAGKSTLVKSILGITKYEGTIWTSLRQEEISAHLQQNNYVNTMPVKYIIEMILSINVKKDKKLQDLISYFNFERCMNKKFVHLSGGEKQRLTIILVLYQDTPLVFFDEVTSGLDFETRQKLMQLLTMWYEGKNSTLCMVSHYYEELEQLVNKLLILDQGRIIAYGNREDLFHTYCGKTLYILENKKENQMLVNQFKSVLAPEHLIALTCDTEEEEKKLAQLLIEKNVDYKRSNSDIEILSINAKAMEAKKVEGGKIDESIVA